MNHEARRVLVVDEHEHSRHLIVECLSECCFAVDECANGDVALDWLTSHPTPDLLVVVDDAVLVERARRVVRLAGLPAIIVAADGASLAALPSVKVLAPLTRRALLVAVEALFEETEPTLPVSPVAGKQAVHVHIRGRGEHVRE